MTAPNTPQGHDEPPTAERDGVPPDSDGGDEAIGPPAPGWGAALRDELRVAALVLLASALLGVVVGLVWCWVAPRVPLYADATSIYLKDPEGEQQAAADGWFAVLGALAGVAMGALAYWRTRRRGGGAGVALSLALGGLLGGWIAWQVGSALGPGQSLASDAKTVPLGRVFSGPIDLHAHAALVAWPALALLALIGATSAFTPKDDVNH